MLTLPGKYPNSLATYARLPSSSERTAIKMMFHFQFTQDINSFMPPICFLYMEFICYTPCDTKWRRREYYLNFHILQFIVESC